MPRGRAAAGRGCRGSRGGRGAQAPLRSRRRGRPRSQRGRGRGAARRRVGSPGRGPLHIDSRYRQSIQGRSRWPRSPRPATVRSVNVLFVTLDQFRADAMGTAGHPLVRTPTLDSLAADGVRFASHYSQAAPCSPGRAALYTGTYQMNNRVVANGTPLADRFDNVARVARRSGFDPTLFGYTDIGLDPLQADGPADPRLGACDGVLPGFAVGLQLPEDQGPWLRWLAALGYEVPAHWVDALRGEPDRAPEHSHSAFLADRFLEWLDQIGRA